MLNNARCETEAAKPTFRQAFQRRRCIIPASGFYEWQALPGQKTKQPFYLSHQDGTPMSFAGIWETVSTTDGERLDTCAILTTGANAIMQPIHDRMPVILARDSWDAWLIPGPVNLGQLQALMAPPDPENLQACRVSTAVNRGPTTARNCWIPSLHSSDVIETLTDRPFGADVKLTQRADFSDPSRRPATACAITVPVSLNWVSGYRKRGSKKHQRQQIRDAGLRACAGAITETPKKRPQKYYQRILQHR